MKKEIIPVNSNRSGKRVSGCSGCNCTMGKRRPDYSWPGTKTNRGLRIGGGKTRQETLGSFLILPRRTPHFLLPFSPTNSDRSPTKDTDEGLWRVTITSADFDNLLKPLVIGFSYLFVLEEKLDSLNGGERGNQKFRLPAFISNYH
jgi:hypothetical protein